jgi:hypothetical protein
MSCLSCIRNLNQLFQGRLRATYSYRENTFFFDPELIFQPVETFLHYLLGYGFILLLTFMFLLRPLARQILVLKEYEKE